VKGRSTREGGKGLRVAEEKERDSRRKTKGKQGGREEGREGKRAGRKAHLHKLGPSDRAGGRKGEKEERREGGGDGRRTCISLACRTVRGKPSKIHPFRWQSSAETLFLTRAI